MDTQTIRTLVAVGILVAGATQIRGTNEPNSAAPLPRIVPFLYDIPEEVYRRPELLSGWEAFTAGRWADCIEATKIVAANSGDEGMQLAAYTLLGAAYYGAAEDVPALESIAAARSLASEVSDERLRRAYDATLDYYEGLCLSFSGDTEQGRRMFVKILETYPDLITSRRATSGLRWVYWQTQENAAREIPLLEKVADSNAGSIGAQAALLYLVEICQRANLYPAVVYYGDQLKLQSPEEEDFTAFDKGLGQVSWERNAWAPWQVADKFVRAWELGAYRAMFLFTPRVPPDAPPSGAPIGEEKFRPQLEQMEALGLRPEHHKVIGFQLMDDDHAEVTARLWLAGAPDEPRGVKLQVVRQFDRWWVDWRVPEELSEEATLTVPDGISKPASAPTATSMGMTRAPVVTAASCGSQPGSCGSSTAVAQADPGTCTCSDSSGSGAGASTAGSCCGAPEETPAEPAPASSG